ncbi:MAG: glycosyl hydrolase family 39 [Terriglobales bacterium]
MAVSAYAIAGETVGEVSVKVDWTKVECVSRTIPTLQVVVNPLLRRGSPIHDQAFQVLSQLHVDDVRFVPWFPYPRLAVAELLPPTADHTSWDFSLIDPVVSDFMDATHGHTVVLNFSTIPEWMFKTAKPVETPSDPDEVDWSYEESTQLRDPIMREVSEYFARIVGWYTQGGFTDELGHRHDSGHHYKVDYWEILNEPEYEHAIEPQMYTRLYDAVATAIHQVDPGIKFVGMSLATPSKSPDFFEYFLDSRNHLPGIPLDAISYHFYAVPTGDESSDVHPFTFFEQADHFLDTVRYAESIRRRLSRQTQTMLNEVGTIRAEDIGQADPAATPLPASYWNLSGAVYAYLYGQLAGLGVNVVGESQLVGYPSQFPSVSMVDWTTGRPNARYWVLKMLRENFGPGDRLVETKLGTPSVYAQGFATQQGTKKLLIVNKRDRVTRLLVRGAVHSRMEIVDQSTGFNPPFSSELSSEHLTLSGLAVAVVTLPN